MKEREKYKNKNKMNILNPMECQYSEDFIPSEDVERRGFWSRVLCFRTL